MTRQEYDQKREAGANAGFTGIATYINDSMIKDEYIESLEARIAELEAELKAYKFALENAIIDRTLGGNTPLAQYVADARAELNRQAQEERCLTK